MPCLQAERGKEESREFFLCLLPRDTFGLSTLTLISPGTPNYIQLPISTVFSDNFEICFLCLPNLSISSAWRTSVGPIRYGLQGVFSTLVSQSSTRIPLHSYRTLCFLLRTYQTGFTFSVNPPRVPHQNVRPSSACILQSALLMPPRYPFSSSLRKSTAVFGAVMYPTKILIFVELLMLGEAVGQNSSQKK